MAKIKTKNLKDQYLFRVYDDNESELLHRALIKFKDNFNSQNDAIKYFACVGADKMLGDNNLNQSINFSEIRKYMQGIDEKLENIKNRQKVYFAETNGEILANQSMTSLNTKLLTKSTGINLRSYTPDWKYSHDDFELDELKNKYKEDLLNGKR